MTKTFRKRAPSVLDLVDESPGPSSHVAGSRPAQPSPEQFDVFYRREYPRLLVLARALAGAATAEAVAQESHGYRCHANTGVPFPADA